MKISTALFSCAVATAAYGQNWTLPPPSVTDGVLVQSAGMNGADSSWGGSSSLSAYSVLGDGNADPLAVGVPDSKLGLTWTNDIPASFAGAQNAVALRGGTVRAIFLGETAGWLNNFGYSRSGSPGAADSFTIFSGIRSGGDSPSVFFGQHVDIALTAGQASSFDFWFNAANDSGGGVYTVFDTMGSGANTGQFVWADRALSVPTWVPSLGAYANIDTYLISVEDIRNAEGLDRDYSDFRFAIQFLTSSGENMAPIPEPAHFAALVGLAAIAGAVYLRRRQGMQAR